MDCNLIHRVLHFLIFLCWIFSCLIHFDKQSPNSFSMSHFMYRWDPPLTFKDCNMNAFFTTLRSSPSSTQMIFFVFSHFQYQILFYWMLLWTLISIEPMHQYFLARPSSSYIVILSPSHIYEEWEAHDQTETCINIISIVSMPPSLQCIRFNNIL